MPFSIAQTGTSEQIAKVREEEAQLKGGLADGPGLATLIPSSRRFVGCFLPVYACQRMAKDCSLCR